MMSARATLYAVFATAILVSAAWIAVGQSLVQLQPQHHDVEVACLPLPPSSSFSSPASSSELAHEFHEAKLDEHDKLLPNPELRTVLSSSSSIKTNRSEGHKKKTFHMKSDSPYSSHSCVRGTCLFHNICLDKGVFTYFKNPYLPDPKFNPPLSLKSSKEGGEEFKISVQARTIPLVINKKNNELTVYIHAYVDRNYGHVLGDEAWPIFQAMSIFDVVTNKVHIIRDRTGAGSDKIFRFISIHDPISFSSLVSSSSNGLYCFSSFVVGYRNLGYAAGWGKSGIGGLLREFRQFSIDTLNLRRSLGLLDTHHNHQHHQNHDGVNKEKDDDVDDTQSYSIEALRASPHTPTILILIKDTKTAQHPNIIVNMEQWKRELEVNFPNLVQTSANWAGMSVYKQMYIMSRADVLVTLPGSDLMNGLWLAEGAEMIVPCRFVNGKLQESNEIGLWFVHLPYIEIQTPCYLKDTNYTGDANDVVFDVPDMIHRVNISLTRLLANEIITSPY